MPALATIAARVLLAIQQQAFTYLLGLFRFSVDQAAPLPATYTEPGAVGSLAVVDTNSVISTSGGVLLINGTPAAFDRIGREGFARLAGRTLLLDLPTRTTVSGTPRIGWNSLLDATTNMMSGWSIAGTTTASLRVNSQLIDTITLGSGSLSFATVLRAAGAFLFVRAGSSGAFTLAWVDATATTTPQAVKVVCSTAAAINITLGNLRVVDLGTSDARFATDEGPATDRKATNSAGDTITMPADAWVEQTLTAATGVDKDLYLRWIDDNNTWIVRQNQAGSTVKLIEKVAGVETSRLSVAQTFTNGTAYRLIAVCDTTTITVYVQPAGGTPVKAGAYASATTNQTATTAKAPSAGTELKSYPRFATLPVV